MRSGLTGVGCPCARPRKANLYCQQQWHGVHNSRAILKWVGDNDVDWHYINPGKPQQTGFIESFNGKLRDECLNETLFGTLRDARKTLEEWQEDYNWRRPPSALGNLTPLEFFAEKGDGQTGRLRSQI